MATKNLATEKLAKYFKDYSSDHKTKGNQATHYFGITAIVVGLLGLLSQWVIGLDGVGGFSYLRFDGGVLLLILGLLWYLYLDWKISIPFALVLSGLYCASRALPMSVNLTLFILGWIFQAIGHLVYEKRSPAFFRNLVHLMIGPLWIFCKVSRVSLEQVLRSSKCSPAELEELY